jgi:hypothetical protein
LPLNHREREDKMTAVGHLATSLYLKGKFRDAPLLLLLLGAAAPDVIWAILNLAYLPGRGPLEIVRISAPFQFIGSQRFLLQPWSHSLLLTAVVGLILGGLVYIACRRWSAAIPVSIAVLLHWFLDYLVHDADLTLGLAPDALRVGPPFVLNPESPALGLFSTAPFWGFALQTLVVIVSTAVFLRSFPIEDPKGRLKFWLAMGILIVLPLPLFIQGAMAGMITSVPRLIMGAVAEMILVALVIYFVAKRVVGPGLAKSPLAGSAAEAASSVRRLCHTGGALCWLLAVFYLLQGMLDAQSDPGIGISSTILGILYFFLGRRLFHFNLSTLWATVLIPLVLGPILRLYFPGTLAVALAIGEVGLGLLSLFVVRTLLRRDILL